MAALDGARPDSPAEGSIGGGTGTICNDFKGGIGPSSRRLITPEPHTVGVLVQANHGERHQFLVAGAPVGREVPLRRDSRTGSSSILVFTATDVPLHPHQLERLARRCALGLARSGSISENGSGDLFLAFSTANAEASERDTRRSLTMIPNDRLDPVFEAVVQATDKAIVNCLVAAEDTVGFEDHRVESLPRQRLVDVLAKYCQRS